MRPEAQRFIAVMSAGDGPVVAVPEAAFVDGGPIPNHDIGDCNHLGVYIPKIRDKEVDTVKAELVGECICIRLKRFVHLVHS